MIYAFVSHSIHIPLPVSSILGYILFPIEWKGVFNMLFNPAHNLQGCRFDNLLRLFSISRWKLLPKRLPQTALLILTSLLLYPFALLEAAISARPVRREKPAPPIFILGHWRSGTTFLQNVLTRDPALTFADPVSSATYPYFRLLGWFLKPIQKKALRGARPMDNMKYGLDLPIEDTFAVSTVTPYSIILMCCFPDAWEYYVKTAFVEDLPDKDRLRWRKTYDRVIRKLSMTKGHRPLVLKSPDNTCRVRELMEMYPDARYVCIHRDPYVTIQSTIHMFTVEMELLQLTPSPDHLQELLEDTLVEIFRRMYRGLFAAMEDMPKGSFIDVAYESFSASPMESMRQIYDELRLPGFEDAAPAMRAYVESQKNYVKNHFEISPRLEKLVDENLGFYMERYGYLPLSKRN